MPLSAAAQPRHNSTMVQPIRALADLKRSHIHQYRVPTNPAQVDSIVGGPNGSVWFYETAGQKIGEISEGGSIVEYDMPNKDANMNREQITRGGSDYLWFSAGDGIYKITTKGVITLAMPGPIGVFYLGIAQGPDGNVWAAASQGNLSDDTIIRFSTKGLGYTEFTTPTFQSGPACMATGADGDMWFAESNVNRVAKITMEGVITEYPLKAGVDPACIVAGDDGFLYAGDTYAHIFHRLATDGSDTVYQTGYRQPNFTQGPRHKIWLSLGNFYNVGGLQTYDTATQTFSDVLHFNGTEAITEDSDGNMWFVGKNGQFVDEYDRPFKATD
jgi:streptogramin lyase